MERKQSWKQKLLAFVLSFAMIVTMMPLVTGNNLVMEADAASIPSYSNTIVNSKQKLLQSIPYRDKFRAPYSNAKGYIGYCESWVGDVYHAAGLSYTIRCCAGKSKATKATTKGTIPVGAVIYSGVKTNGSTYKSQNYPTCDVCGKNCGHVGIYIGNNKIVGANAPFAYSWKSWVDYFGYGGYYAPKEFMCNHKTTKYDACTSCGAAVVDYAANTRQSTATAQ